MPLPLSFSAQMVRDIDPNRFRATLFAPEPVREHLFALYAAHIEVSRISLATKESYMAQMRYQFWRDLTEGAVGLRENSGPIGQALLEAFQIYPKARESFLTLLEARKTEIEQKIPSDEAAASAYFQAVGGGLLQSAACFCQVAEVPVITKIGFAQGVANGLLATARLAPLGRAVFPNITARELQAGTCNPEFIKSLQNLAGEALEVLEEARDCHLPKTVFPVLLAGWDSERLLKRAIRGADPYTAFAARSEFATRFHPLWRGMRGKW